MQRFAVSLGIRNTVKLATYTWQNWINWDGEPCRKQQNEVQFARPIRPIPRQPSVNRWFAIGLVRRALLLLTNAATNKKGADIPVLSSEIDGQRRQCKRGTNSHGHINCFYRSSISLRSYRIWRIDIGKGFAGNFLSHAAAASTFEI